MSQERGVTDVSGSDNDFVGDPERTRTSDQQLRSTLRVRQLLPCFEVITMTCDGAMRTIMRTLSIGCCCACRGLLGIPTKPDAFS
jgi:hypothetical protein